MAGLLSDVLPAVYSASNTMKNKLRGLLDDPLGTLQQVVGDANDRARSFNQMGDRSAAETMASIKAGKGLGNGPASNALLGKIADAYNPVAMTVWHGSPHQFSKFDASKIGTGEGAQAYGHGLYLAENPEVAQSYQRLNIAGNQLNSLGNQAKKFVKEQMFAGANNDAILKAAAASKSQATRWDAEDVARGKLATRGEYVTAMDEVQGFLKQNTVSPNNGALYKVDLPDEHIAKMLDWDKPLSQQHPEVQAIARKRLDELRGMGGSSPQDPTGEWLHKAFGPQGAEKAPNGLFGQSAASVRLRDAGIPGIRYLDGGSRGAGAGSSNFVVFPGNEDMLTILERNGQPVNALRGLLD